tara:strand:+ start:683 stop:955 length:273 start_codon:yes stop_codon:yes gene_type:complete
MTKYSQQYDNKLLEGILDHMANELKSEFGFSTLDEEDTLDVISLFVDNPDKYETAYLHSIETKDTEVIPSREKSNVEILQNLSNYTRYDG